MKIKIYCLNEYDWWAGESLKEVKKSYLEITGIPEEEAFENPYELSDEEMDTLKFWEDDGVERTFREQLNKLIKEGEEFPCFFATTEN